MVVEPPPALVLFDVWEDAENITNRTVKAPPKTGQNAAPGGISRPQIGTTWHYAAQDQPLHVSGGGLCALSSEGVCILGFRPDLHRVQGAVATWVKTGENPAAERRAGGKRGGMQGPCGCARGTPF